MSGVRFAPSPTGRFHVGNLRTAWISHAVALALGEPWVVRFEDIDRERTLPGAQEQQLADLRALGLEPARIEVQTQHHAFHQAEFERARREGRVYACGCSRREVTEALRGMASAPHGPEAVYSGACRNGERELPADRDLAWRFRVEEDVTGWSDFIVARARANGQGFLPAYHWACALDDAQAGYSALVRASDLMAASIPQRRVQLWWGSYLPPILHTALLTQNDGHRLEKRTQGVTWGELLAQGWTRERLEAVFRQSWDRQVEKALAALGKGRDFCEDPQQVTLNAFGL